MSVLVSLLVAILILGLVIYAIRLLPLDEPIKNIAIVIVIILVVVYMLRFVGVVVL